MNNSNFRINSGSIAPSHENVGRAAASNSRIGKVAENLSRIFLGHSKQPRQANFSAVATPNEGTDEPLKPNLLVLALDILSKSDFPEAASMALAISRNSSAGPLNALSQLYKARTVRELPSQSELSLNLPNGLKLLKALAGLAERFVDPLLSRENLSNTEKANLDRSLGKLAGLATLLLKPLFQSGELHKLDASVLKSMSGLLNKEPSQESEQLRNALSHAISKQSMISTMNHNSSLYQHLSEDWRSDLDVSLVAINKNSNLLEYASDDLKNNQALVFAAAQKNRGALQFASPRLRAEFELLHPPTE